MIVMSVFGTRPEAIKMAPLVKALQKAEGIQSVVCVTAQHRQMLDQVLKQFDIVPDYDLDLMKKGQTLTSITSDVITGLETVFNKCQPDIVLVHGDTTTSMAAALAAFYRQIPVGHIEAGLRSFDVYSPFPEEMNRQMTGRISTLHFAPTLRSRENLARENIVENVYVVGNTVIDALHMMVHEGYVFNEPALKRLRLNEGRWIVLTAHRRENLGQPLKQICAAIKEIVQRVPDVHVVYPVHPNPAVREVVDCCLLGVERVHLIEPIEVESMHNLINLAYMVMTDSGGLQEEAPALGKPVIVLRTETERPEVVEAGKAILAGVETDKIVDAAMTLLENSETYIRMTQASNPYGDGHTSEAIVAILQEWMAAKH